MVTLQNYDWTIIASIAVVDKLPISVHPGTTFFGEHLLAILPAERKVTVRDYSLIAIVEHRDKTENIVLTYEDSRKWQVRLITRLLLKPESTKSSPLSTELQGK